MRSTKRQPCYFSAVGPGTSNEASAMTPASPCFSPMLRRRSSPFVRPIWWRGPVAPSHRTCPHHEGRALLRYIPHRDVIRIQDVSDVPPGTLNEGSSGARPAEQSLLLLTVKQSPPSSPIPPIKPEQDCANHPSRPSSPGPLMVGGLIPGAAPTPREASSMRFS